MDKRLIAAMVIAMMLFVTIAAAPGPPDWANDTDNNDTNKTRGPPDRANRTEKNDTGKPDKNQTTESPGQWLKQQERIRLSDCKQNATVGECVAQMRTRNREIMTEKLMIKCQGLAKGQEKCEAHVEALGECWGTPPGLPRAECAKTRLGIGNRSRVREEVANCTDEECMAQVKEKVYAYVTFRFQGLAERAQGFLQRGADEEAVGRFLEDLDGLVDEFTGAETLQEKKQVLSRIRQRWSDFAEEVGGD